MIPVMLSIGLLDNFQNQLEGSMGSIWIVALIIIVILAFALLIVGVDFRFTILLLLPLLLKFSDVAWIPKWIGGLIWIVAIGIGLYILYNMLKERI